MGNNGNGENEACRQAKENEDEGRDENKNGKMKSEKSEKMKRKCNARLLL